MPTFGVAIRAIAARQGARVFRAATRDIQRDATGASVRVDRLNKSVTRLGGTFGLIARSAAGFLGSIAAIAGIRSTVKNITDFEEAITRARVRMDLTSKAFEPLREGVRQLAVETRFTAVEVSDAFERIAQSGARGATALRALRPALDLASVGAIGVKESIDVLLESTKQFELGIEGATRVADVFTTISNRTNATISDLSEGFRKVGRVGFELGIPFEQLASALGLLQERMGSASRAGTAFRSLLLSLESFSEKNKEKIEALGLSVDDFSVASKGLIPVLKTLNKFFSDVGDQTELVNKEAVIASLTLTGLTKDIDALTEASTGNTDATKKMAAAFEDNLGGAFRRLISAVTDLQLEVGDDGLLGVMRTTVEFTTDVIKALKGQTDGFINAKKEVLAFTEVLKSLGVGGGIFISITAGLAAIKIAINTVKFAFVGTGVGGIVVAISLAATAMFNLRKETVLFNGEVATVGDFAVATFTVLKEEINFAVEGMSKLVNNAVSLAKIFKNIALSVSPGVGGDTESRLRGGDQLSVLDRIAREAANRRRAREGREQALLNQLGTGPATPGGGSAEQINNAIKKTEELTKQQQELIQFTQEFGDTVADSFGKMISGAESAGEAIRNLVDELLELIIKQTLLQPLANTISFGLSSAIGGSAAIGAFTPNATFPNAPARFAHGGVIGGPTRFRDGLAGEAGPEAILPLKRTSDGDLGVSLAGGSSVVVNMSIQTPNADSFRKSQRQIISEVRRVTARLS